MNLFFVHNPSFVRSTDISIEWRKNIDLSCVAEQRKKEKWIYHAMKWRKKKEKENIKQTNTATNALEMNAGIIILKLLNEKETVFYHLTQYKAIAWIIFELPDNRNGPSNDSLNIAFNLIICEVVCWMLRQWVLGMSECRNYWMLAVGFCVHKINSVYN